MTLGSLTNASVSYDITLDQNGKPVRCTCPDHQYRKRTCKHMQASERMLELETSKAQTFLSLKERYDVRSQSNRRAAYVAMFDPCLVA